MAGRKLAYTDAIADEIVGGIAVGMTDRDAAAAAGISEDTFGRWMKGQRGAPADLAERIVRARAQRARMWLGGIRKAAADGDWRAYAELLDRCSPTYRKRDQVEHSGPAGGPVRHEHTHRVFDFGRFTTEQKLVIDELAAAYDRGEKVG